MSQIRYLTKHQDLRSAYYEETEKRTTTDGTEPPRKKGYITGKNRTNAEEDNPFASDDEEDAGRTKVPEANDKSPVDSTKAASRKRPMSDSEDEGKEKGPPKKAAKSSGAKAVMRAPPRSRGKAGMKKTEVSDSE